VEIQRGQEEKENGLTVIWILVIIVAGASGGGPAVQTNFAFFKTSRWIGVSESGYPDGNIPLDLSCL
jgi:hypothetical protein